MDEACVVCHDPNRYNIEQAFLEGGKIRTEYTRQQIERHMSHIGDPRALALITDLANTSALAGRLRQLETMAVKIMDAALTERIEDIVDPKTKEVTRIVRQPDGALALRALKEARQTLVEMGRLTETLQSKHENVDEAPDLDAEISAYIRGRALAPDEVPNTEAKRKRDTMGPLELLPENPMFAETANTDE